MNKTYRLLCLAPLMLALGTSLSAAEKEGNDVVQSTVPRSARQATIATKDKARLPPPAQSVPRPGDADFTNPLGQAVYQVLLAEIALRRGDTSLASALYADLASRSRDPKALERAIDIASFARRYDLALDAARQWVEVEPNSRQARYALASVMILSNQTDDLAPTLIRMLEVDKESLAENLLGLNRMLVRLPDRQIAFRLIDRVCQPFFGIAEAHYAVSVAAGAAGSNERALVEARKALELRPDWEMAALLQAQLLMRSTPAEGISFLQGYVEKYPEGKEPRLHLARTLVGEKRYDEARKHFDILLKSYPDSPEVVFPVAILALQHNDQELAETQLKHFLTLPAADKNYAFYYLGQIAEDGKRMAEAMAYYARVVSGEHYVPAQLRRARLLVDQGRFEEARWQLSAAKTSTAEERIQLSIAEAGLLRDAKQIQAAFDLLDALLTKNPDQPELLYETALLGEKLGKLELLETRLRRLIELRPESAQAYNALGYSLADRNLRLTESRELIEKALSLAPEDYFILDSMGWVLFRQGDLTGALAYLEKAYARREDPEIAAHIGEVLWGLGRKDDASRVWLEAQKKFPSSEVLVEVIRKFLP